MKGCFKFLFFVVGLLFIGGVGLGWMFVSSSPLIEAVSTHASPQNSDTKSEAGSAPHLTIPGIAAVDVYGNLTNKGFTLKKSFSDASSNWDCTKIDAEKTYSVTAHGSGAQSIHVVKATFLNRGQADTSELAANFFGYLATLPFEGNDPEQTRLWVNSNINHSNSTQVGVVRIELITNAEMSNARTLRMSATKTE